LPDRTFAGVGYQLVKRAWPPATTELSRRKSGKLIVAQSNVAGCARCRAWREERTRRSRSSAAGRGNRV